MNNVLIVGCGHMGSALLESWNKKTNYNFSVIEPKHYSSLKKKYSKKINFFKSFEEIKNIKKYDIIVFAIKPQIAEKVIRQFKINLKRNILLISIIAGKKISFFSKILGSQHQIIRVMPNMPASVGKGITCLICKKEISRQHKKISSFLFKKVGEIIWLNKESEIDKITAISGSGPAYFYFFIECLLQASKELNLSDNVSKKLVYNTVFGSIKLLENSTKSAKKLKENIAVKGGTTEAAINIFEKDKLFKNIVKKAVFAAYRRSLFLGKK